VADKLNVDPVALRRAGCRAVCRGRSQRRCWAASVVGVTARSAGWCCCRVSGRRKYFRCGSAMWISLGAGFGCSVRAARNARVKHAG